MTRASREPQEAAPDRLLLLSSHSPPETTSCDVSLTPRASVSGLLPPVGHAGLGGHTGISQETLSTGTEGWHRPDGMKHVMFPYTLQKVTLLDSVLPRENQPGSRRAEPALSGLYCQNLALGSSEVREAITERDLEVQRCEGQSLLPVSMATNLASIITSLSYKVMR